MLNGDRHASVSRALGPGLADTLLQPRFSPLAGALGGRERPVKSLTRAQGARRGLVKSRSERAPGPALAGVTSCQTLGNDDMDGTDFVVPPVRQSYKQPIDLRLALPTDPPAAEARELNVSEEHVPVQPKTDDHAWQQPGATAYVRFGHLEGDDGWYECTLGEQEGGADPGGNQPPRHRARRHRRWPGNSTPSNGRGCRDDVASIAWGARHLISTQAPGA